MPPRLRSGLFGTLALLLAFASPVSANTTSAPDPFVAAANHSGVPAPLLAAIGYTNTHWKMYAHASDFGDWGLMQLNDGAGPRSIPAAMKLSGRTKQALELDPNANLDGGALLLARAAGRRPATLEGWYSALDSFGGSQFADDVFATLHGGASGSLWNGAPYQLKPQNVSPRAAASVAHSPDNASSGWMPADPSNYTADYRPYSYAINTIVIHVTEGSYSSAVHSFQTPNFGASAHYVFQSSTGNSTQTVREHDIAWHAGNWDYNTRAIGIEHEGYVEDPSWFTSAMYHASAGLVAQLVQRYSIPIDRQHIVGHNEVPDPYHPSLLGGWGHHTDPGPYWNWSYYLGLVRSYVTSSCSTGGASAFSQLPGAGHDVAANSQDRWLIGTDPQVLGYGVWHWTANGWVKIPNFGAVRIAVDPNRLSWVINMNQDIYHWTGTAWQHMPGSAYDIGIGSDGTVWIIGTDDVNGGHGLYKWTGTAWQKVPGGGVHVAVAPDGTAWIVAANGNIWHDAMTGWVHVPGAALSIGVDAAGAPWVIGTDRLCGGYGIWTGNDTGFAFAHGAGDQITGDMAHGAFTVTNGFQVWWRN